MPSCFCFKCYKMIFWVLYLTKCFVACIWKKLYGFWSNCSPSVLHWMLCYCVYSAIESVVYYLRRLVFLIIFFFTFSLNSYCRDLSLLFVFVLLNNFCVCVFFSLFSLPFCVNCPLLYEFNCCFWLSSHDSSKYQYYICIFLFNFSFFYVIVYYNLSVYHLEYISNCQFFKVSVNTTFKLFIFNLVVYFFLKIYKIFENEYYRKRKITYYKKDYG